MSDDEVIAEGIKQLAEQSKERGLRPQEAMNEQTRLGQIETLEDVKNRLLKDMDDNLKPPPPDDPTHTLGPKR